MSVYSFLKEDVQESHVATVMRHLPHQKLPTKMSLCLRHSKLLPEQMLRVKFLAEQLAEDQTMDLTADQTQVPDQTQVLDQTLDQTPVPDQTQDQTQEMSQEIKLLVRSLLVNLLRPYLKLKLGDNHPQPIQVLVQAQEILHQLEEEVHQELLEGEASLGTVPHIVVTPSSPKKLEIFPNPNHKILKQLSHN